MRKVVYRLVKETPPALVELVFALLLVFATVPALRILLFGFSIDDLLQLRCFDPG
jgi:hypothetical protein